MRYEHHRHGWKKYMVGKNIITWFSVIAVLGSMLGSWISIIVLLGLMLGFWPIYWLTFKDHCKNYFIALQDKHNKFLSSHPDVSGWETNDKETMVWVRSEVASVPRSLFGLPTTIILELASKEPYRGSGKEVVLKKNKHYFFQEMWYGFMESMEKI